MYIKKIIFISILSMGVAHAGVLDELNPQSPNIENILMQMDQNYEEATGLSAWLPAEPMFAARCYRAACPTWARINLKEQLFYLYINGELVHTWLTSTGAEGYRTPLMDRNPNGRIYDAYSSKIYPGGDYEGLGNMPYAVFIVGGYAIHGTPEGNWSQLGTPVSGGCIRLLPDQGKIFNRLVRASGRFGTWITVESGE